MEKSHRKKLIKASEIVEHICFVITINPVTNSQD